MAVLLHIRASAAFFTVMYCFIHHLGKPEAHDPSVSVQTLQNSPFN